MNNYNQLLEWMRRFDRFIIAFSGGVDSSFLLKVASDAFIEPQKHVVAISVKTPYIPDWEFEEAKEFAQKLNLQHELINLPIPKTILHNPPNRCYLCKKKIFTAIKDYAKSEEINTIFDGTNFDDRSDYRPGMRALEELNIISPLLVNQWTKKDIRAHLEMLRLSIHDKPAYACLLTRIPHGKKITFEALEQIEKAELYLHNLGIRDVRVRSHDNLARIEVPKEHLELFFDQERMASITTALNAIGYKHVTLDLSGYQMGSFNKVPESKDYE